MTELPKSMHVPEKKVVSFAIPKAHNINHETACQDPHSLNFIPGSGRTDAESSERSWSVSNHIASSTKEMGPGSYRDTIDNHLGSQNHRKNIGLGACSCFTALTVSPLTPGAGTTLGTRFVTAKTELRKHAQALSDFNDALKDDALPNKWRRQVIEWEEDQERVRSDIQAAKSAKEKVASPYQMKKTRTFIALMSMFHAANSSPRQEPEGSAKGVDGCRSGERACWNILPA
jgi:hypothetical protein